MHFRALFFAAAIVAGSSCVGCLPPLLPLPDAGASVDDLEFQAILGDNAAFLDGGQTSFAGLDFTISVDAGVRTMDITGGVHLVVQYPDDHHVTVEGDLNGDDVADLHETTVLNGTQVQVRRAQDLDFDGVDDSRVEQDYALSQTAPVQFSERSYRATDAGWALESSQARRASDDQNGGETTCFGTDHFPSTSGLAFPVVGPAIQVISNGEPSAGTEDQPRQLVRVIKNAIRDAAGCLVSANPAVAAQLRTAIATRPLNVACGNPCAKYLATTDLPTGEWTVLTTWEAGFRGAFGLTQRMNIRRDTVLDGHSDLEVEEVVLHELLHFAGVPHTTTGPATGRDRVYGCGRYCTGFGGCKSGHMTKGGENTPESFAWDCFECADTTSRRDACGVMLEVEAASPADCCADDKCSTCNQIARAYYCDAKTLVPGYQPSFCCSQGADGCANRDIAAECVPGLAAAGSQFNTCSHYPVGQCLSGE